MSPIAELRASIPYGILTGLEPVKVYLLSVMFSSIVFFPIILVLNYIYKKMPRRIVILERYLESVRRRGEGIVNRFGVIGLIMFVAIPLPFTGAWTGSILSWLLGVSKGKAYLRILGGSCIAGAIVLGITLGVL